MVCISFSLPLDERFVLASNGKHALGIGSEGSADNVLTVSRVARLCVRVIDRRVAIDVNQTPIVARDEELLVRARLNLVNVRAILTRWVHTVHGPAKLDGRGGPDHVLCVGETGRVVRLLGHVEVELFVGAAHRSNVGRIGGPIKGSDERIVLRERFVESVGAFVAHRVHVEVVVVGGECEELLVRRVACHLAPFSSILQAGDLSVEVVEVADGYFTHVAADYQVVVFWRVADCACLLVGGID